MDGLLALDLWDRVIEVLRSTNHTVKPNHDRIQEIRATLHSKTKAIVWCGYVPTNTHSSQGELYIFEDNEAVIQMIIKGRSPTMRPRVKNPQSCAWLVVRQNQFGTQDPNHIFWRQKPICRHSHQWKFSTWLSRCSLSAISVNFSDDRIGKQSVMSKKDQEATSSEGSPMAKPKFMAPAKARPLSLVARKEKLHKIWCIRSILWMPMNQKKWN